MSEQSEETGSNVRGRPPREAVYERLDTQIEELWQRMGGLPSPVEATAADIWRGIMFEEVHHSTAIEGNTLVFREVERLLSEGRVTGTKQLSEYMEVVGYATAAEWVYQQARGPLDDVGHAEVVTLTEVRQVHRLAMAGVWEVAPHPDAGDREGPGSYREHEIHPFPGGMEPVSWPLVPAEMSSWVDRVNALEARAPYFCEELAEVHCRFEQIHPFIDGNGRTGRLLLNLILVRLGYPPVVVSKRDRTQYLRALRQADGGQFGLLGELLARGILDSLYRFIIPAVAGPARLVPLAALASKQITSSALRVAAVRGRLQATRGPDGQWRSTQKWVDEYLTTRYRR